MDAHSGRRVTPADFAALLAVGAITDSLGPDGFSGHALVNAHKAMLAAASTPGTGDPEPGGEASPARGAVVLLRDPTTGDAVTQITADANGRFRLDAIAPAVAVSPAPARRSE